MINKSKRLTKSRLLKLGVVIVVAALVLMILELTGVTHLFNNEPKIQKDPSTLTKITQLPKQPAANDGEKKITSSSNGNQGTGTDNNGVTGAISASPDQWTSSQSGVVTVKSPISGSTIKSGVSLIGSSTSGEVQFRLIDDRVGVISQGSVSVVNKNFSALINFKSNGSSGRLDVFTVDSYGREFNEVQLEVKF